MSFDSTSPVVNASNSSIITTVDLNDQSIPSTVIGGTKVQQLAEPTRIERTIKDSCPIRLWSSFQMHWLELKLTGSEILARRANISYLSILIAIIGVSALLLIVGLAAGLGANKIYSCKEFRNGTFKEGNGDNGDELPVEYDPNKPWTHWRLSRHIIPRHYNLTLTPTFYTEVDRSFRGSIIIDAEVAVATRLIVLHAVNLNISSTIVADSLGKNPAEIRRTFFFDPYNYFVIELKLRMKVTSNITIKLEFSGNLNIGPLGFYKSSFLHPTSGKKLFVAMTQFEALHARRAFPCFDEPNLKAFFTIAIQHRSDFLALSNMPQIIRTQSNDGDISTTTRFQTTNVPMPTYLVAFVVGQYASLPSVTSSRSKVPITVYAPDYALEQTRFALDVVPRMLDWMENYFGVDYPLPKLDLVVYPELPSNAMENYGLISFTERAILDSSLNSQVDRDFIVNLLSHELAHLWFGNLVTMDWWTDLWLNEGMASYMEFPAAVSVGRLVDSEEYYDYLVAISDDCYQSSKPLQLRETIRTTNDIFVIFDVMTYVKGSTIARMLVNTMGLENFKSGIQNYMRKFKYQNTKTPDLWAALSKDVVNITQAMSTWSDQNGFPLVTVQTGSGENEFLLQQEPFTFPQWYPENRDNRGKELSGIDSRRWWIPLTFKDSHGAINTEWFPSGGQFYDIRLPAGSKADETKLNVNQTAYMRVNYPEAMWQNFGAKLSEDINAFDPIDRAGLVDDCLELAKAGRLNYSTAFKVTRFMAKETHPLVWDVFVAQANFLNQMLRDSPQYSKFKAWLLSKIRSARIKAIKEVKSASPDNHNPNYKRILTVLAEASLLFDPGFDAQCYISKYYGRNKWKEAKVREIRRPVFIAFIQTNDTMEAVDELLQIAKESRMKQIQREVFYAITTTKHFGLLSRELEKVFTSELSWGDFWVLAFAALDTNAHRAALWDWARDNFERLMPAFNKNTFNFMRWFVSIGKYFNSPVKYDEFQRFMATTASSIGKNFKARRLVEEQMRRNIYWRISLKSQLESSLAILELSTTVPPSVVC